MNNGLHYLGVTLVEQVQVGEVHHSCGDRVEVVGEGMGGGGEDAKAGLCMCVCVR